MGLGEHIQGLYRAWRHDRHSPDVPVLGGTPVLGQLAAFRSDAYAVLRRAAELGDIVRFNVLHQPVYFVGRPEALPPLFDSQDVWLRGEGLQPLLGRNVLTTNGEEWRRGRSLAQPTFHPRMVARLTDAFASAAREEVPTWDRFGDQPFDAAAEAVRLFARAASPTFGLRFEDDELADYPDALLRLQSWGFMALAGGSPRSAQVKADFALLDRILARALAAPPQTRGPPTYLERIRQDHSIPRDRLADHLRLVLIASTDNPPNTVAFALWQLARNPAWEEALRAELDAVLAGEAPDAASLEHLPLLGRVVDETLRICPSVYMLARTAQVDTDLGGHPVGAGTLALAGTWLAHRHPSAWTEPDRFDPDRFLPERSAGRHRFAYLPFGSGPRRCIGSLLARQQMCVALALILQRFTVSAALDGDLPLRGLFALRSTAGVPCRLEPRRS